ncbi:hypothetical protein AXF42_Ash007938 [Apostasia shenzhenica]|uniref:Uncharacterized protein n=1 Tax=Apostasia shenzhenica TaxID=1088818 RepID=A0A2I0B5T1_9ASPA|nr:hypothetical protein AXF42_Ash007938 [Apostasia shenzhenica]
MDIFSSVVSPSVGFLAGSSLLQIGNSFFRGGAATAGDRHHQLDKPLIPPPLTYTSSIATAHSKPTSFFYPSALPPPPRCSTSQAIVNGNSIRKPVFPLHPNVLIFMYFQGLMFSAAWEYSQLHTPSRKGVG